MPINIYVHVKAYCCYNYSLTMNLVVFQKRIQSTLFTQGFTEEIAIQVMFSKSNKDRMHQSD